jgi:hypothetical protein
MEMERSESGGSGSRSSTLRDEDDEERSTKRKKSGGIMNFVEELFWKRDSPSPIEPQTEEENEEEEDPLDNHEPEQEEFEQELEKQIVNSDGSDPVELVVVEEDEEPPQGAFQQNLTQLTPSENAQVADDPSVQDTELGLDEDHETISNAPSDFENQLNASNLRSMNESHQDDDGSEEVCYKGKLIHKMSFRELGMHLKSLGLKFEKKKEVRIRNLVRAARLGLEGPTPDSDAPDETESQVSMTPAPKTPKRKRGVESPPSTRQRSRRMVQQLELGTVKVPTRLVSARKTVNSQKDSYITITSPQNNHGHHPQPHTPATNLRRSSRKKRRGHTEEGEEPEEEDPNETSQQDQDDAVSVSVADHADPQPSHQPHQEDDDHDSELEGYYSPSGYNPHEDEPDSSLAHRLPQDSQSLSPEPTLSQHGSSGRYDYEDLTDSVSIVETASVAATNGSALSPLHPVGSGPLSTLPLDQLPPPQRYPQYLMRNRNTSPIPDDGHGPHDDHHLTHRSSHQSDDDDHSSASFQPHSSFSPPGSTLRLHENRSRGPTSSGGSTPFDDAMGAVGSRFVAMLRGEGPQLSDAEYSFFKTLLESKRPPGSAPLVPSPPPPQPQSPVPVAAPAPPVVLKEVAPPPTPPPTIEPRKVTAVDTCVQTEDEDYERKKRTFSESESSASTAAPVIPVTLVVDEVTQSSKRRREMPPAEAPATSHPPFKFSLSKISFGLEPDADRDWMAPRRHSLTTSHTTQLPRSSYTSPPRSDEPIQRAAVNPQHSLPLSLQVQHQSLSQSNQTAAISSVQRRLMRRRTTFQTPSEDAQVASRSSANGVVAKRILETLGEITATLDEQRRKPLTASPSGHAASVVPQNKVRFLESTPQPKPTSAPAGPSIKDRIATPKAISFDATPSPSHTTPSAFAGRGSADAAEPLWSRERGRAGASLSPPVSTRHTLTVNSPPQTPQTPAAFSLPNDSDQDEFTFNAPKDIEGLEDDVSSHSLATNKVRFIFSPPAKKVSKKYPPTPGGSKLKAVASEKTNPTKGKASDPAPLSSSSSSTTGLGLDSLINRSNSIKCSTCMVFNDKTASRCVACDSKLSNNEAPKNPSASSASTAGMGTLPDALVKRPNSLKCPMCLVFNDKSAARCVACDSKLSSPDSAISQPVVDKTTPAAVSSGFTFGSNGPSSGASFGSAPKNPSAPATTFGSSAPAPSSTISFGKISTPSSTPAVTETTPAAKPSAGFSFGSSSAAASSGILFGSGSNTAPPPPVPKGFSFAAAPSVPAPVPTPTGFSFGAPVSKPAPTASGTGVTFGASAPASAPSFGALTKLQTEERKPVEVADKAPTVTVAAAPSFSFSGKSFTGFGAPKATDGEKPVAAVTSETMPSAGFQPPASQISAKPFGSFGTAAAVPSKGSSDEDESRKKKRQAEEPEQKPSAPAFSASSFSFGGARPAEPAQPSSLSNPFSGSSKFASSAAPAITFGQSAPVAPSTPLADPSKSSAFGSSLSGSQPFTPVASAPFGSGAAPKFGSAVPVSQTFGKPAAIATPIFGAADKTLNRANSVATPPPPPYGSESPGNMDTGYSGDTNTIPSGTLPPPSSNTFASPFGGFGAKPTPAASSLPSNTFGGFGQAAPPQQPTTPSFGMFGSAPAPSTFGSGSGFGSTAPFSSFGAPPSLSQQPFGQQQQSLPGLGGGGFSMGVAEKNSNQAGGVKGRRKVKPTWKAA